MTSLTADEIEFIEIMKGLLKVIPQHLGSQLINHECPEIIRFQKYLCDKIRKSESKLSDVKKYLFQELKSKKNKHFIN